MRRLRILAVSILLGGMALTGSSIPAKASSTTTTTTVTSLPRAACAQIIASLGAQGASMKDTGCTIRATTVKVAQAPVGSSALSASAVWCTGTWQQLNYYSGPLWVIAIHVNVGMCFNGSATWADWGPDCYTNQLPIYGSTIDWCGVYHNGYWEAMPGSNFDFWLYITPWNRFYHWARINVYGNGYISGIYGG